MVLRCLLVDDSPHFLGAARSLLEREGLAVVGVASTGEEALAQIEEVRPDLVLVDIDLGKERASSWPDASIVRQALTPRK
jgi:DNA-binding NarL/FixJ family response regulator